MFSQSYFQYYFIGVKSPLVTELEKTINKLPGNYSYSGFTANGKQSIVYNKPPFEISQILTCEQAIAKLPINCSVNLITTEEFSAITILRNIPYGKAPEPNSYPWKDVTYAAEEGCENPDDCTTDEGLLIYDVFYPTNYPYNNCTTFPPCVIFFHAGGYSDCNSIADAGHIEDIAKLLARRGFICFSVEYRRGRVVSDAEFSFFDPNQNFYEYRECTFTSAQLLLAFYRGQQDARGAIRTILQRNDNAPNTDVPYKFDKNNIFLAGFSAGAGTVIGAAYYTQSMIDQVDGGAHNVLGPVDADFYVGAPTREYQSKIKGILHGWGGSYIPKSYITHPVDFFTAGVEIPVISFHGTQDLQIAPFNNQPAFYPLTTGFSSKTQNDSLHPNFVINPETGCLPDNTSFTLNDVNGLYVPDLWRFGSKKFFCLLNSLGVYSEVYLDTDMEHGINGSEQPFNDDFGTTFSTEDSVYGYIAIRTACFFQAILYGQTHSTWFNTLKGSRKVFVNCANFRWGCGNGSNHDCNTSEPQNFCTTID